MKYLIIILFIFVTSIDILQSDDPKKSVAVVTYSDYTVDRILIPNIMFKDDVNNVYEFINRLIMRKEKNGR